MGRRSGLLAFVGCVLAFVPAALADSASAAPSGSVGGTSETGLEEVLKSFDEVQESIQSLTADFTQTTENRLLKEPLMGRGRFYMSKPASLMWEYSSPETMKFVISDDEYVGYFPNRKRAERRNIQRWSDQIFRMFGLGQVSAELEEFYEIELREPSDDMAHTYVLLLEPRKRRVKKRMDSIRLWVSRASYLPVKVEYRDQDGNTRVIRFDDFEINPDLSAGLFDVDIPSDVTVTTGFTGLSAVGSTQ